MNSFGKFQLKKQPPRGVPKKRCSENMQQIYRHPCGSAISIKLQNMGVLLSLCVCVCVCVYVCVISNKSSSKKAHVPDLSKLDALLHKTHRVLLVLRYLGSRCVDP